MSGGHRPRQKGDRLERALVRLLQQYGIISVRVPQSGAKGGRFRGDLVLPLCGRELVVEVKHHSNSFRQLYKWLTGRDLLLIKADHKEILVVVPLRLAIEIIEFAIPFLQRTNP
jgi:Holliday junction resolvase